MKIETKFKIGDRLWCLAKKSNKLYDLEILRINILVLNGGIYIEYKTHIDTYYEPKCCEKTMQSPDGNYLFFTDKEAAVAALLKNGCVFD